MLCGTGSDVGKSVLVTALCRIMKQDGRSPAPFKAQNMAPYYALTPQGLRIARAQGVQAEASGLVASTDMNPLMLIPQGNCTSEVILNGESLGLRTAMQLYDPTGRQHLREAIGAAYNRLATLYAPIIMEGAGSISELNLREADLVNLPMARYADADVILVADIDRGGVFASCYGSIALQRPEDRARIKGIIVNKFRGDIRLFEQGRKMLADICGVPVLGVIPMFSDICIEEEDTLHGGGQRDERLNDADFRQHQYDRLAAWVRPHIDMETIYKWIDE